jgi:spore coat polysaccharide biosynthesis protein SpsF (cytidylyltransferase family)
MEQLNNTGIICCTRMKSTRVPNKCALDINGKSILEHLHSRLLKAEIPIIYAYPNADASEYKKLFYTFEGRSSTYFPGYNVFMGHDDDPLQRMYQAAKRNKLDTIIRVVHDKIFVDDVQIKYALQEYRKKGLDYLYSSTFTDGTAFEIFSFEALEKAATKFKNVEHITYAIKAVSEKSLDYNWDGLYCENIRLLIDFPEDVDLMRTLFAVLGNDCSQMDVLKFMTKNTYALNINKLPKVTIYTCAYNADKWVEETMYSVLRQNNFATDYEYILVDDCSTDNTALLMSRVASHFPNVKYIRNTKNIGLASSSNLALSRARGKHIIRLDADDTFVGNNCIEMMLAESRKQNVDALYPNYYNGNYKTIGLGAAEHHPAGTLFKTLALNHIRFKDGLRHYDGLDVYKRAKEFLNIGYLNRPIFFYRHHTTSMSKNNLDERAEIKRRIEAETEWAPI